MYRLARPVDDTDSHLLNRLIRKGPTFLLAAATLRSVQTKFFEKEAVFLKRTKFLSSIGLGLVAGCSGGITSPSVAPPDLRQGRFHATPAPSIQPASASPSPTILSAQRWSGVTIDNPVDIAGLYASLSALPTKPIARLCFDAGSGPTDFTNLIRTISPVANILGQPFDSSDVATTSQATYTSVFQSYLNAFPNITAWEVGNELNGEWLGTNPQAKAYAAWQMVKAAGKKSVLTLYYEPQQTVTPGYDMIPWAIANIPADMKAGLDYVLVSYYEVDNNNIRPTPSQWTTIFQALQAIFPNSYLGFGEVGLRNPATSATLAQAQNIMSYYYQLVPISQNWIGGYFWWYFAEDCVPTTTPLYTLLKTLA